MLDLMLAYKPPIPFQMWCSIINHMSHVEFNVNFYATYSMFNSMLDSKPHIHLRTRCPLLSHLSRIPIWIWCPLISQMSHFEFDVQNRAISAGPLGPPGWGGYCYALEPYRFSMAGCSGGGLPFRAGARVSICVCVWGGDYCLQVRVISLKTLFSIEFPGLGVQTRKPNIFYIRPLTPIGIGRALYTL